MITFRRRQLQIHVPHRRGATRRERNNSKLNFDNCKWIGVDSIKKNNHWQTPIQTGCGMHPRFCYKCAWLSLSNLSRTPRGAFSAERWLYEWNSRWLFIEGRLQIHELVLQNINRFIFFWSPTFETLSRQWKVESVKKMFSSYPRPSLKQCAYATYTT